MLALRTAAQFLRRPASAVDEERLRPRRTASSATYPQNRGKPAQRDVGLHAEMRKRVPAALAHNGEESLMITSSASNPF